MVLDDGIDIADFATFSAQEAREISRSMIPSDASQKRSAHASTLCGSTTPVKQPRLETGTAFADSMLAEEPEEPSW